MRQIFLLKILFLLCVFSFGQNKKQKNAPNLFSVYNAYFTLEEHKWGNELFFIMLGKAHPTLKDCSLDIDIFYYGQRVRQHKMRIKYTKIELKWGPLNEPYERVLSGKYTVKVSLLRENQSRRGKLKLKRILGKKEHPPWSKDVEWGNKNSFDNENKYIEKFYRTRIDNLTKIYKFLAMEARQAFSVTKDIKRKRSNPYILRKNNKRIFHSKKWQKSQQQFHKSIQKELQIFRKFHKKLFCRRYKIAKTNVEEFIFVLLRYARLQSVKIHEKNNVKVSAKDTSRIDPFGIRSERAIVGHLKRLLKATIAELKMTDIAIPFK